MGSTVLTNAVATTVSQGAPTTNQDAKTGLGVRTGGLGDAIGYIYWPRPFPLKATIISAQIVFYTAAMAETGTHTFTFQRLGIAFSASKVTWNTRPLTLIAGTKTVARTGAQPTAQQWTLDVTDWMQSVSNGGAWYGVKFQVGDSIARFWYAENNPATDLRPRLEVTWSDAPATPSGLAPSGGRRVGVSRPIVRATYLDVSGSTQLQAIQVQANATDVWTAPTFDSGTVLTSVPELDLSTTAFASMADGSTMFWRVRLQDAAGLWSPYSASTSFVYDNQATLVLNSPGVDPGLVNQVNLVSNPKAGAAVSYYAANGSATISRQASGGPTGIAPYVRNTFTAATATADNFGISYAIDASTGEPGLTCIPGDFRSGGVWIRASKAQRVTLYLQFINDAGTAILSTNCPPIVLAANTWTWMPWSNPSAAPAGTTRVRALIFSISGTGAVNWAISDTLDVTGLIIVPGTVAPASFFDGDTSAGGGFSYRWTGAADNSPSEQYTPGPSSQLKVEDATPVLIWTFTGETQAAYQVQIYHLANNVRVTDWDSGKVTSTINSLTVPAGKINEPSGTVYTLVVRVWDNKQREAVPGSPVYVEAQGAFTFVPKMAVSPVTALTVTAGDPEPKVTLSWSRGIAPDRFNVLRNGKVIAAAQDPVDLLISGSTYGYTDNSPSPQRSLTYSVQSVVNNQASATNPTAVVTVRSKGIWLREPISGLRVCIVGKDDNRAFTLGEASATLQSIAQNANKVAINQSLGGLEGRIEGSLESVYGRTAQQWRDDFLKMRALRVKRFWLTVGDYTFQVVAQNFSYGYQPTPTARFRVGFDFYQQDAISSTYLGA